MDNQPQQRDGEEPQDPEVLRQQQEEKLQAFGASLAAS